MWLRLSMLCTLCTLPNALAFNPPHTHLQPQMLAHRPHRRAPFFMAARGGGSGATPELFRNSWGEYQKSTYTTPPSMGLIFVHSVWMDRLGVLGAWVFLLQTAVQVAAHLLRLRAAPQLNLCFNVVYSAFYGAFLLAYKTMLPNERPRTTRTYMLGVALYFLGYCTFALYYSPVVAAVAAPLLFHAGLLARGSSCSGRRR